MAKVNFIWQGPASAVTLKSAPSDLDVVFLPGYEVSLPDDNDYVRSLISQGYLVTPPASGGNS